MPKDEKTGLGSGLDALFGPDLTSIIEDIQNSAAGDDSTYRTSLNIADIHTNPYQPRRVFDQDKLNELAQSIKEHGVFTPILVRPSFDGYQLIAGERRLRAAQLAGNDTIPAIVMDFTDDQMMEISLLENVQREDLTAIEEANAYKQLIDNLHYTQEELGKRLGKSREHISNTLRLLKLPTHVQELISQGKLTMGQARPLITVEDEKQAGELADRIIAEGLSVRRVEKMIRNLSKPLTRHLPYVNDSATAAVERNLQHQLQTRVKISRNAITISYSDVEDLNRILELIGYTRE
ncbi:MAG: ParB/RepB/Spo0J family partition protein [Erysipelotrichaceae bacterium]|nr:ParB/RepB/Spo0J family partition protein [Erysipelotrichaceae bacterium]